MPGSRWHRCQPRRTRAARSATHARRAVGPARPSARRGKAGRLRQMSEHRLGTHVLSLTAICAAPVLYALWVRPRLLTWGATREETSGTYPGDELIPDPAHSSTMAATLPAPPERIWPWLVQMGYDRAGWYSWDKLDHSGQPSADHIVPQWQDLREGQRVHSMAHGRDWMT